MGVRLSLARVPARRRDREGRPGSARAVRAALALGVAAAVGLAAGCAVRGAPAAEPPATPVRIGMLAPLTGHKALSGHAMVNAARLAVKEANAAGGVLGRDVELLVADDACDSGTAVTEANDLVARGITVSVGGYCSSSTVPVLKTFRAAGIPMIVPLANSTDLLAPGYDSVFLLSGTVTAEGRFAVDALARLGARRLAVVHDGTSFPVTLAAATVTAAKAAVPPITVVAELALAQGAPSYHRIADSVLASGADAVYFSGYYGEAGQLVRDLRTRRFTGLVMVGDGATDAPLLAGLPGALVGEVYGTSLLVPELMPEAAGWVARYRAEYGVPPSMSTVESYDAVLLAVDAIRRAGSLDRAAVRAAIGGTGGLELVSGPVRFGPDGVRADPRFLLLRATRDGFVLAERR